MQIGKLLSMRYNCRSQPQEAENDERHIREHKTLIHTSLNGDFLNQIHLAWKQSFRSSPSAAIPHTWRREAVNSLIFFSGRTWRRCEIQQKY
ncbi:MAG: hypothetical protein K2H89_09740 [Oscillospiraceae bacterium]|nr:hypothetical protein [Oscillospiraceae bacterium]